MLWRVLASSIEEAGKKEGKSRGHERTSSSLEGNKAMAKLISYEELIIQYK